jgi:hypothetical protein
MHRSFQTRVGTPIHLAWNGEGVQIGSADAEETRAVVDLALPISTNDRGEGVTGRGKLIFADSMTFNQGDAIWIRGERWEFDCDRKPEDGNRMVFVIRREQNFTSSRLGGYSGGR